MTGRDQTLSKVPAVTLGFWVIKILATTLGETGGDTVTMTMKWGYPAGSALFVDGPRRPRRMANSVEAFPPLLVLGDNRRFDDCSARPWRTSPTARSASATPAEHRSCLPQCSSRCLALWYWSEGSVSVNTVNTPKVEAFYWATITVLADARHRARRLDGGYDTGLGYVGGAAVFACAAWHSSPRPISGRRFRRVAPVLGGVHPHQAAGRDALATSSTSLMTMAALLSAARSRRWLSWPLWF